MYGPSGIRTNAVAPGPTITNIQASFGSELGAHRVQAAMQVMPSPIEANAVAIRLGQHVRHINNERQLG